MLKIFKALVKGLEINTLGCVKLDNDAKKFMLNYLVDFLEKFKTDSTLPSPLHKDIIKDGVWAKLSKCLGLTSKQIADLNLLRDKDKRFGKGFANSMGWGRKGGKSKKARKGKSRKSRKLRKTRRTRKSRKLRKSRRKH